jgi:hypothetical protein
MQNIKPYKKFLNEATGLLGTKEPIKKKNVETPTFKPKAKKEVVENDLDQDSLFQKIYDKISHEDNSPIYVYNRVSGSLPYYIGENFIKNGAKFNLGIEDNKTITLDKGKLSYVVLDMDLLKSQTAQQIQTGFQNLYLKNASSGKFTLTEFSNFSSGNSEIRALIISFVTNRKIGDYKLRSGEFFILSDNSNSIKGGKDVSRVINRMFPETGISAFSHSFSGDTENSK